MGFSIDLLKCYHADNKKRIGRDHDGGYVIVDGYKYDLLLSCGVGDDLSFEEHFLSLHEGLPCKSFDGTLNHCSWIPKEIEFHPLNISGKNTETTTNLKKIIDQHQDIFLKMDIEGAEYEWIDAMESRHLNKIKQFVVEFHSFDRENPELFMNWKCLEKLTKTHDLVHIHGNNFCPYYCFFDKDGKTINSVTSSKDFVVDALFLAKSHHVIDSSGFIKDQKPQFVPGVFEATFVHKSLRNGCQRLNQEAFPHKYDMPNCQNVPDVFLRNYPYTSI